MNISAEILKTTLGAFLLKLDQMEKEGKSTEEILQWVKDQLTSVLQKL